MVVYVFKIWGCFRQHKSVIPARQEVAKEIKFKVCLDLSKFKNKVGNLDIISK